MSASEKVDAWMPLWIGSYLADTMDLTRDEHGGYLLLLIAYWRNKGPLPDDDKKLSTITRCQGRAEWKRLRVNLEAFFTVANGLWTHGRADQELSKAGKRKADAVSKAKAGAEARWGDTRKQRPDDAPSNAPSMPQAVLKQCPTPSPIPSPSESSQAPDGASSETGGGSPRRARSVPDCPHQDILALWAEVLPELPQHNPNRWTGDRAASLRARWRETAVEKGWATQAEGLTYFRALFGWMRSSDFLMGRIAPKEGRQRFFAELEWVVTPKYWNRVVEGKYRDDEREGAPA